MTDVSTWSQTDGSNTSTAPAGAPEGMAPSAVNDVLRAIMGSVAREQAHINFTATSGGAADVQTLSYSVAPSAYFTGQRFAFIAGYTNSTTTPTLNVNSLGAKTIVQADGSSALRASQITAGTAYEVEYDGTNFRLVSGGSFSGPASSTNNGFVLFNGTTGQLVKDAGYSTVPVASGGTGATSITSGAIALGAGTGAITSVGPGSSSQIPVSNGTTFSMAYPKTLQRSFNTYTTVGTNVSSSRIPFDNTIPQSTEGVQLFSVSFTPISASSRIRIRGIIFGSNSGAGNNVGIAVFKDSNASASYATWFSTTGTASIPYEYEEASGSTTARTYKVRVGNDASNFYLNADGAGTGLGGGVQYCSMIIEEINL